MAEEAASRPTRATGGVGRSMLALAGANLFPPLAALATAPLLARSLGVAGRGEVAAASAPFQLATAAATFGLPEAITYFVARGARPRATLLQALRFAAVSGVAVAAVVVAASGWLSGGDDDVQRLIVLGAAAVVPALLVGLLRGAAGGLQRWGLVARERITSALLRFGLVLVLVATDQLTTLTATVVVVLSPVAGAVSYLDLRRDLRRSAGDGAHAGEPGTTEPPPLVRYGSRVWVGAVAGVLLLRLDQAIMAPLSDVTELGLYAVAASVSEVPLITTGAMREVIFAADAAGESDTRLAATARVSALAAACIGGLVCLTLPLWFTAIFGSEFDDARAVALVLTAAVVLGAPGSIVSAGLSARGRPGLRSTCLVVATAVNLGLLVLLVPDHGAMGAAVATLVGNLTAGLMAVAFLWSVFRVRPLQFYGLRRGDLDRLVRAGRSSLTRRSVGDEQGLP